MIAVFIETSLISVWATTVTLNTDCGCNIIRRSSLLPGWQHHECSDYEIPAVGDANKNLLQILSAFILRVRFGSVAYITIFLVTN